MCQLKLLIVTFFLIFFIPSSFCSIETLPSDHIAIQFVVQIERTSTNTFIGVGTLITFNHILTLNSTYSGLQVPQDVRFRFRSITVGTGFQAQPEKIFHHQVENLAIALMRTRVNEQFSFAPRDQSFLLLGRFCTVFGFYGRSLTAIAAFPSQCENFYCAPHQINFSLGNFEGSPVICDGNSIGGIVKGVDSDKFVIEDVGKYDEWIKEVVSGSSIVRVSLSVIFVGFILSKNILSF
jgi:hypothetical protein